MNILRSKSVRILSVVLLAQAGVFYGFQRRELVPAHQPLANFSIEQTGWKMCRRCRLTRRAWMS